MHKIAPLMIGKGSTMLVHSQARSVQNRVRPALIALAWLWVALPFAYGAWQLFTKITQLFGA